MLPLRRDEALLGFVNSLEIFEFSIKICKKLVKIYWVNLRALKFSRRPIFLAIWPNQPISATFGLHCISKFSSCIFNIFLSQIYFQKQKAIISCRHNIQQLHHTFQKIKKII